ncbi:carbohydrate-binding module family 20 domain-containing protein [Streptomyces sp. NPDC102406]|uniref:carbohydrate-binding module family 20 domain-containing protein n=1 Tax=Streptomyces sp. NPDC102406 TaxID=3366171 RepID=UPI0037F85288
MLSIRNRVPAAWRSVLMLTVLLAGLLTGTAAHAQAATSQDSSVTFRVVADTEGETLLVSGSTPQLGSWDPAKAVPLGTTAGTYPHWSTSIQLPAGATVQYKYIKRSPTGTLTWESIPNRTLTVSQGALGTDDRWNVSSVSTTFRATATTGWGQNLYVTGNRPELGNWDPAKALPLTTGSATYPLWSGTHQLPPDTAVQYKYFKKNPDSTITWESGDNRAVVTPTSGTLTINDTWR